MTVSTKFQKCKTKNTRDKQNNESRFLVIMAMAPADGATTLHLVLGAATTAGNLKKDCSAESLHRAGIFPAGRP